MFSVDTVLSTNKCLLSISQQNLFGWLESRTFTNVSYTPHRHQPGKSLKNFFRHDLPNLLRMTSVRICLIVKARNELQVPDNITRIKVSWLVSLLIPTSSSRRYFLCPSTSWPDFQTSLPTSASALLVAGCIAITPAPFLLGLVT